MPKNRKCKMVDAPHLKGTRDFIIAVMNMEETLFISHHGGESITRFFLSKVGDDSIVHAQAWMMDEASGTWWAAGPPINLGEEVLESIEVAMAEASVA